MKSNLDLARSLYEAFASSDAEALLKLLHPDFEGEVTAGLPRGFGGTYKGPQAQFADCWARVAEVLDVRPQPTEFLATEGGDIVVLGSYIGCARFTGKQLEAAFVHVLGFHEGRIVALRQITDSQRWVEALTPEADPDPNAELVGRMLRAVEDRDLDALLATYHPDIVIRDPASLPTGGVYHGHPGAAEHGAAYVGAWDPLQDADEKELEEVVFGAGNRVVGLWRQKATAPNGQKLDLPAISLATVRDGRVIELEMFHFDTAAIVDFLARETDPRDR